ncbi:MAG: MBL fold metallo-hydrolase [bacterium]
MSLNGLILCLSMACLILSVALCSNGTYAAEKGKGVRIRNFGHACFLIESLSSGTTVLIDPYSGLDYPDFKVEADIVLMSHEHFDHNSLDKVKGKPEIIHGLAKEGKDWNKIDRKIRDVKIRAFPSYHDKKKGADRGKNTIFVVNIGGLSIAHLGDLGHVLEKKDAEKLSGIDILLVPVGGFYTIEPEEADEIASLLKPHILIPMHYKTKGSARLPIKSLDVFLKGKKNVEMVNSSVYVVSPDKLPKEMKIVALEPR